MVALCHPWSSCAGEHVGGLENGWWCCQTRYPYPEKPGPVLLGYGYGRVRVRVSYFYLRVTRDIH